MVDLMRRTIYAYTALAFVVLAAGCQPLPSTSDSPAPAATGTVVASPSVSPPYPQGLLVAIRTTRYADHDSVEFEFGGAQPPQENHHVVTEVHADPSDQPVPLQGKAFLEVVFQGAALDNMARELDPAKVRKYPGPTRIAPGLPVVKEIAVSGNFENVLSFGVGLDRQTRVSMETGDSPARVILNFWY
jgi:hypothetical protein